MIACTDLTKSFGDRTLFEGVSMQFVAPNRYGIVGANGSGKSTFLRILSGQETATDGVVSTQKRARLGVLHQDRFQSLDQTIIDVAMMGHEEAWRALRERDALLAATEEKGFDAETYGRLEDEVVRTGAYALEARAGEILEGLGIPTAVHQQPLGSLSGGFRLRALLAQVLAAEPDVLLLDEPTNHLDILSIKWLEEFLQKFSGCALIVSHDHGFLDGICTHIVDVDYETLIQYPGNYSKFLARKDEAQEQKKNEIEKQQRKIAETERFIERFKAKASKARQAQSRVKQLSRMEVDELVMSSRRAPHFAFQMQRESGRDLLKIENVSKAYEAKQVLSGVGFDIRRGERVALIGPNGIGKSTLLKILVDEVKADTGAAAWGHEAHVGYFPQDHKELTEGSGAHTVESWLWQYQADASKTFIRGALGAVLFSGDDAESPVRTLSGGEAARLLFAKLTLQKPNVLVLDEPTNHLDLESIEALADALNAYEGTLIFVSHDRWFVSKLATRIVELLPTGLTDYAGTYAEFLERGDGTDHLDADVARAKKKSDDTDAPVKASAAAKSRDSKKRDDGRRKKLERQRDEVVAKMESLELEIESIDKEFCVPGYFEKTPASEAQERQDEQQRLRDEVATLVNQWEDIEAELDQLQ